jgi:hypothetical protein
LSSVNSKFAGERGKTFRRQDYLADRLFEEEPVGRINKDKVVREDSEGSLADN